MNQDWIKQINDDMERRRNERKQYREENPNWKHIAAGKSSEKINMKIAKEIRQLYASGNYTQTQLAKQYKFKGSNTISEIIQNITYFDESYIAPNNSFVFKKNATIVKILNELPEIFTSKDMANQILKLNIRSCDKLAMKEARRILLKKGYFEKLPLINGKAANQHNPQYFKKIQ